MKKNIYWRNKYLLTGIICLSYLSLGGCTTVKEATKGFLGISTRELEDTRKGAISREFAYDYGSCYQKVKASLKKKGAYIYRDDPAGKMIAVYVTDTDTTPVGIFFTVINNDTTKVEVSSPSTYAKELISKNIFNFLDNKPDEDQKGEKQGHEKEEHDK
jgi:hypothetical protein